MFSHFKYKFWYSINPDFDFRDKYDRRSERSCDSPRTSASVGGHYRLYSYGSSHRARESGVRSPSPLSNCGRYKPSTQAISPPRDSFSEGEGKHYVPDLRDSLNRSKENRNNRYNHRSGYNIKDPRSSRNARYSDLRGLVSPTSSGDEKDYLR